MSFSNATKTALGRMKKKCLNATENSRIKKAFFSILLKLKRYGMEQKIGSKKEMNRSFAEIAAPKYLALSFLFFD